MAIERKKFFPVHIDLINKDIELIGTNIESLGNRFLKIDLTPELKGKSIEIRLKTIVRNEKIDTEVLQIKLLGSYIRRMMNKGTNYIENSYFINCKDEFLQVKQLLITRRKVQRKVRSALKIAAEKEFIEYAKDKKFEDLVLDIINNKVQKEISLKLKKIYPLSLCEIKFLSKEDSKKHKENKE
ncbi:MAG TPA: hypothetical protein P5277_03995 [Candidatus Paceibacterota bacterium]|nr:hypothetical protein [Candidatus Paceibacterota bacterium]